MYKLLVTVLGEATAILWSAAARIASHWQALLLALLIPVAGSIAVTFLQITYGHIEAANWGLLVPALFFYVLFAVSCHRLFLLGNDALPNQFGLYWSSRESWFAAWVVVVGIIVAFLWIPFAGVSLLFPYSPEVIRASWYVCLVLVTYFEGRISLVLPAAALNKHIDLVESWRLTHGHGVAIALALLVVTLAGFFVRRAIFTLAGDNSGFVAYVVSEIALFPIIALGVGVLSVSYQLCRGQAKAPSADQ